MNDLTQNEEEIIICEALGIDKAELISHPELLKKDDPRYKEFKNRIDKNEPLAYITGIQPFYGFNFFVDKSVLIPRPETELLVEICLDTLMPGHNKNQSILDIGTGSGAIAVCLAKYLENAAITAIDISKESLAISKKNSDHHNVSHRIKHAHSDLFESIKPKRFDAIISNPPYIPSGDIEELEPNVRDHEPRLALDGGIDGLNIIRDIIKGSKDYLKPNGYLFLELGCGQSEQVKKLLEDAGYKNIRIIKDYAGIDRIAKAQNQ
ncbi:peptide chain release factor N(5)-glutamine methyltransferase [Candidatus Saganbacteria bacterium]|nr:peptide chain release factor N(5)-glutamine methyltransferase [Candidatus Saganbacteria bacterium]